VSNPKGCFAFFIPSLQPTHDLLLPIPSLHAGPYAGLVLPLRLWLRFRLHLHHRRLLQLRLHLPQALS
jgi:hypothetical protein